MVVLNSWSPILKIPMVFALLTICVGAAYARDESPAAACLDLFEEQDEGQLSRFEGQGSGWDVRLQQAYAVDQVLLRLRAAVAHTREFDLEELFGHRSIPEDPQVPPSVREARVRRDWESGMQRLERDSVRLDPLQAGFLLSPRDRYAFVGGESRLPLDQVLGRALQLIYRRYQGVELGSTFLPVARLGEAQQALERESPVNRRLLWAVLVLQMPPEQVIGALGGARTQAQIESHIEQVLGRLRAAEGRRLQPNQGERVTTTVHFIPHLQGRWGEEWSLQLETLSLTRKPQAALTREPNSFALIEVVAPDQRSHAEEFLDLLRRRIERDPRPGFRPGILLERTITALTLDWRDTGDLIGSHAWNQIPAPEYDKYSGVIEILNSMDDESRRLFILRYALRLRRDPLRILLGVSTRQFTNREAFAMTEFKNRINRSSARRGNP